MKALADTAVDHFDAVQERRFTHPSFVEQFKDRAAVIVENAHRC